MPRFMVESYPVGLSAEQLMAASSRAVEVVAQIRADGVEVRLVEATLVPQEESLFCLFEAPSREVVEDIVKRAGLPLERVVAAVDVGFKEEG
jgi:hypothetical protein